jgi:CyaY protein
VSDSTGVDSGGIAEREFEQLADRELHALLEALIAASDELDPDLESGVLSIHFDDDTKYVVNSHRAAKQIWMAAERAAWHFDYQGDDGLWVAKSSGDELWSALTGVLTRKLGSAVELRRASPQ